jgi:D-alanyl-lipoteichoic acid acyltransferase DltB (MBOAT superfamily)
VLFPTVDFAIFFTLVFVGHWLLAPAPRWWRWFMIAASYVFYGWWDWRFVPLLAGVSALAQVGALIVDRYPDEWRRRVAMAGAVVAVTAPLALFKYYGFVSLELANLFGAPPLPLAQLLLPVGISFYTFMAISYVVDVYRRDSDVASTGDVFLYLSFFPHLVAGPIVRPQELLPQIETRRDPRALDVAGSAWLIMGGLFKKVVVSSYVVAQIVDPVFGDPEGHSAIETLLAIWGYAVVIYADFSGYTDIAIGVARLLGFEFPQNFDRPYAARSIQEFWRRWHMTLSRWLRDYLYIPFGGNRKGRPRTSVNLLLTMAIGGLWHGAAWTFVLWGVLHGAYLVVGQVIVRRRATGALPEPAAGPWRPWLQRLVTFHLVCLGWVLFRADSLGTAADVLGRLVTGWDEPTALVTPALVIAVFGMLLLQVVPRDASAAIRERLAAMRPVPLGLALGLALFVITTMGPRGVAPFIYFQF